MELLTLEAVKKKWLHEHLMGGGRVNRTHPPSTFDKIHRIDMKFGTYNKLHYLFFPVSETTWCLIGSHGNDSQINDVTGGRHVGILNFQILFNLNFCT